jgi:hypothetical protein
MLKPDSITSIEGSFSFCDNLTQYEWKYVDMQQALVPFVCESAHPIPLPHNAQSQCFNNLRLRWEEHQVWIVDGILHRGESNILARRRLYLENETWRIVYGEGFDNADALTKHYLLPWLKVPVTQAAGNWYPVSNQPEKTAGS